MERKKKTWQQAFKHIIVSFQQKIEYFVKLRPRLAKKEKKLNALQKTLESHVDSRTSTEKIIQRQLHAEIEKRKQSEQKVEDALEYANGIISTVRNPLIVLDAGLRVISASRSFYKTFKAECKNTEGQHIYELGNRQWDIPKLRELLEDILPDKISFDNFEVEHHFPGIGKRTMILDARKINRKIDKRQLILLSIEDITRRKEAEEKIKDLASHDGLTGCVNFKSTMELLEKEIARSKRHHKKVSIIMIDIDQFKQINDEHSHLAGNDALVTFASIIKKNIRKE